MKIKWIGHATFEVTSDEGVSIVHDPMHDMVDYKMPEGLTPDLLFSSHDHADHNNIEVFDNQFDYVNTVGEFDSNGIKGNGIHSFHDNAGGSEKGDNIIFTYELEGLKITHLGDLGHVLEEKQVNALQGTDILFLPCGGGYTIGSEDAKQVAEQINPKIVIPMHYRTDALGDFGLHFQTVEDFTVVYGQGVTKIGNILEIDLDCIDKLSKVIVMDYK